MIDLKGWKEWLVKQDYSENSKIAYYSALANYSQYYTSTDIISVKAYKSDIQDKYSAQTVNLRIIALNKYNNWIGHPEWKIKGIKQVRKNFLDNVITSAEYSYLINQLKKEDDREMYFLIRFLGSTGARISEVLRFKGESVQLGYLDIIGKGRKLRRIYIPENLREEALSWKKEGFLFNLPYFKIQQNMKKYAIKYKIDSKAMHPHALRHFFALSFIEKYQDLALLADLLGHDNIETTRIYLRRTSAQQAAIVNRVVTW